MHDAWEAPPLDNDEGMNIPDIDYSELDACETASRPCETASRSGRLPFLGSADNPLSRARSAEAPAGQ